MKKDYDLTKGKVRKKPALNPKETKIQTSVRIDGDIFLWLQAEAERQHIPYQTLMNKYLREVMSKPSIESRLSAIEKAVFKRAF
ncbi:BrnA antitoxin family protein [Bdellovibrio bacteriovorus]|uniref:BrnA antitoxin family protein n=1 Tax=Bdellovibrio bacteriovorus TaxID=959 RepID=UPI0035A61759